jgi:ArsR family transcriptional regulator, lead/cadmium/zinc/bismuth-responsive transcriptional repressor
VIATSEQLNYHSIVATVSSHTCRTDIEGEILSVEQARFLAATFQVLGDPTRVRIVHALSLSELCTSDLAALVGMSESAVSHQLRTLRQLHVVRSRREGKLVYYSLDDDHIRRLFQQGLEHSLETEDP